MCYAAHMMTPKQCEMLIAFERDMAASDPDDFVKGGTLAWANRERVITALHRKGYLNADGITDAGRKAIGK